MLSAIKGLIARKTTALIKDAEKYNDKFESVFRWAFMILPTKNIFINGENGVK